MICASYSMPAAHAQTRNPVPGAGPLYSLARDGSSARPVLHGLVSLSPLAPVVDDAVETAPGYPRAPWLSIAS